VKATPKRKPLIRKESTLAEKEAEVSRQASLAARGINIPRSLKPRSPREEAIVKEDIKAVKLAKALGKSSSMPFTELYSESRLALCTQYEVWDASKGANYSTYLNRTIRFSLYHYFETKGYMLKIPRKLTKAYLTINRYRKNNPEISLEEIASLSGVPLADLEDSLLAHSPVTSTDVNVEEDEE